MNIFQHTNRIKKLKTYVEKVSELMLKGKLRFHQLAEIVAPAMNAGLALLWQKTNTGKELAGIWGERLITNISKVRGFHL